MTPPSVVNTHSNAQIQASGGLTDVRKRSKAMSPRCIRNMHCS
jgi:hypothetical protein